MKKGEKQTLIKSNVKINKKSEKLTKDEKRRTGGFMPTDSHCNVGI